MLQVGLDWAHCERAVLQVGRAEAHWERAVLQVGLNQTHCERAVLQVCVGRFRAAWDRVGDGQRVHGHASVGRAAGSRWDKVWLNWPVSGANESGSSGTARQRATLDQVQKPASCFRRNREPPLSHLGGSLSFPLSLKSLCISWELDHLRGTLALCVLTFSAGKKKIRGRRGASRWKKGHYASYASFPRRKRTADKGDRGRCVGRGQARSGVWFPARTSKGDPFPGVFVHDFLSCWRPFGGL